MRKINPISIPYIEPQEDRQHALERNASYFQRIAACYPGNEEEALRTVMDYAGRGTNYLADWKGFVKDEKRMFGRRVQQGITPNIEILRVNLEGRLYEPSPTCGSGVPPLQTLDSIEKRMDWDAYMAGAYDKVRVTRRRTAEMRDNCLD